MKKLRQDSVAAKMPAYLKDKVDEMFLSGTTYQAVADVVSAAGVTWSLTSIAQYYHNHICPLLACRRRDIASKVNAMDAEGLDEAALKAVRMTVFDLANAPGSDPKTLKLLMDLVIKARQMQLDERKVGLLEEKAASADAAKEALTKRVADGGLTPEALELAEEQLKLL